MEAKELKQLAAGRWKSIVTSLAPQLGLAIERLPHHVSCPVHGGVDGFRLFKDFDETGGSVCNTCGIQNDGYATLMWVNGWDFKTTHRAIHDMLLGDRANQYRPPVAPPQVVKKEVEVDVQSIRDSLNHVWKHSIPLSSSEARPARMYLANRGIRQIDYRKIDSNMIRFAPLLEYYEEGKLLNKYPAIVTMVCDSDGRPSTVHRTYITDSGTKAPIPSPKKMMRHCADNLFGAMRITVQGNSKVLAVTEGIETALAVMGVDPVRTLVLPRMVSIAMVTTLVAIPAALITICCGWFVAVYLAGMQSAAYFEFLWSNMSTTEVAALVVNCFLVGVLIGTVCCYKGLNASGGAIGLGRAVNQAVVSSFVSIFVLQLGYNAVVLGFFPALGSFR